MANAAFVSKRQKGAKFDRIEFRATEELKELFEQAASISGLTVSAFIKMAGRKVADEVIESERTLRLQAESYAKIVDLLSNPPEFNEAMTAAIESSRRGVMKIEARTRGKGSTVCG